MERLTLERHQVWIYLSAIVSGLLVGSAWPGVRPAFESLLWPALMLLLYVTFLPIPLLHMRESCSDLRFVAAVVTGNFIILPIVTWGLVQWLPPDPALRLGVMLVLLVPCTDWFITFSQLGGGDVARAIAVTPINLFAQLVLLPFYLWLMLRTELSATLEFADVWPALAVVLVPLVAAALSERWFETHEGRARLRDSLARLPVPLLALVVFLIAGAQVTAVRGAFDEFGAVMPLFAAFLILSSLIAKALGWWMALPAAQGRTLAFSLGTRNSFLVLPLALSLPAGWEVTSVVIVLQSLVELFGMVVYIWFVPHLLFKLPTRD